MVVTDSVAKQLDGLKRDPALSAAVRRFWSHGLDACGPAGKKRAGITATVRAGSMRGILSRIGLRAPRWPTQQICMVVG